MLDVETVDKSGLEGSHLKGEPPLALHVLCEKLELQNERHLQLTPYTTKSMEEMFDDVYIGLQPAMKDYQARQAAIEFVGNLVTRKVSVGDLFKNFGSCCIKAFGSYTMDMFNPMSDLDMSLNIGVGAENLSRENKITLLRKLTKCLRVFHGQGGHISEIQPVLRANVPVVKFIDCRSGVECDVSVENKDGILKSELLYIFSSLDTRFRKLCFLVKAWAKAHDINSSKDRTLNSLTIILLVAFHLQTRSPAILPPFSVFLEGLDLTDVPITIMEARRRAHQYKDFGILNKETVPQLFNSLLRKLVVVKSFWQQGLSVSTYLGSWVTTSQPSSIFVEDFTIRSQNAARAVGEKGFEQICQCLDEAVQQMEISFANQVQVNQLKAFLFGKQSSYAKGMLELPATENIPKYRRLDYPIFNRVAQDRITMHEGAPLVALEQTPYLPIAEHIGAQRSATKGNKRKKSKGTTMLVQTVEQETNWGIQHNALHNVGGHINVREPAIRYPVHAYLEQERLMPQWNSHHISRRVGDHYLQRHPGLPASYMHPTAQPVYTPYQNVGFPSRPALMQESGRHRPILSDPYNHLYPQLYNRYGAGYTDRYL